MFAFGLSPNLNLSAFLLLPQNVACIDFESNSNIELKCVLPYVETAKITSGAVYFYFPSTLVRSSSGKYSG